MTGESIRGVIFDLDGTLYSLSGLRFRMALKLWSEINILRHVSEARSTLREKSFGSKEDLRQALFEELGRRASIDPGRAQEWYDRRFFKGFLEMLAGPAKLRPGLLDLLSRLKVRGVKLAVVSDYDRVGERLGALGVPPDLFDDVCSAEDFGALKPSAKPFFALAQKWGVEPGKVVVVGDRSDLDAVSAQKAGMEFLGVGEDKSARRDGDAFISWQEAVKLLDARTGRRDQPRN